MKSYNPSARTSTPTEQKTPTAAATNGQPDVHQAADSPRSHHDLWHVIDEPGHVLQFLAGMLRHDSNGHEQPIRRDLVLQACLDAGATEAQVYEAAERLGVIRTLCDDGETWSLKMGWEASSAGVWANPPATADTDAGTLPAGKPAATANGRADHTPTTPEAQPSVGDTARLVYDLGCSVCPPTEDGVKRPDCGQGWKDLQDTPVSRSRLERWYGSHSGLGIVTGRVSGGGPNLSLNWQDFDDPDAYGEFVKLAEATGLGELVERCSAGYLEGTPSGGKHLPARVETAEGQTWPSIKLAERPDPTAKNGRKTIVETKAEGGYIIIAPSGGKVHPSGEPYVRLRGSLETIAVITGDEWEALCTLSRTLDSMPVEAPEPAGARDHRKLTGDWDDTVTPWDAYNARTSWDDPYFLPGWAEVYKRGDTPILRRPGKAKGVSATLNHGGSDRLYVFSTSTEFTPRRYYSRFDTYALREHRGDSKAAIEALREDHFGTFKAWVWLDDEARWDLQTHENPCPKGGLVRIAKRGEPAPPPPRGAKAKAKATATAGPSADGELTGARLEDLDDEELGIIPADTLDPERVEWLVEDRIARGKLNLIAGEGGDGKSQLAIAIAAAISRGGTVLDGAGPVPMGDVFILAAEDGMRDTIIPRLIAAGADLARVKIITAKVKVKDRDGKWAIHPMSFQDLRYWRELFRRFPKLLLMIADPIPAFLGRGVNDHRNADVRAVLEPFVDLLAETRVAMIGITHLGKSTDQRTPVHKILGSVAYSNLARSVHLTFRDPDDKERRYFCHPKVNIGKEQPTLTYRIEPHTFEHKGEAITTARVAFEAGTVDQDAATLMGCNGAAKRRGPEPAVTTVIAEWLFDLLRNTGGPIGISTLIEAAGDKGFIGEHKDGEWSGKRALYRAKDLIPTLPEPRNGKRVETLEKTGFTPFKRWQLVDVDAAF